MDGDLEAETSAFTLPPRDDTQRTKGLRIAAVDCKNSHRIDFRAPVASLRQAGLVKKDQLDYKSEVY